MFLELIESIFSKTRATIQTPKVFIYNSKRITKSLRNYILKIASNAKGAPEIYSFEMLSSSKPCSKDADR
jgi:hypothetical protein